MGRSAEAIEGPSGGLEVVGLPGPEVRPEPARGLDQARGLLWGDFAIEGVDPTDVVAEPLETVAPRLVRVAGEPLPEVGNVGLDGAHGGQAMGPFE